MAYFGRFFLDKEKDMIVTLSMEGEELYYVLSTPNHHTGNLITNLARLCGLPLSDGENGLKVIRGRVPCYIDAYNHMVYIFRLGGTKVANIYPDGRIDMKASIPAISKTLMSQTKHYTLDISKTIIKTYIFRECKLRTDLHTHMNGNLDPDILIALGIMHQLRYPLYYVKKLELGVSEAQRFALNAQREKVAARLEEQIQKEHLEGKYRDRRIDDHTYINFADLLLNDPQHTQENIQKIRNSLEVMKDGQAVFTNLEKVYLYRYVFTKGTVSDKLIVLDGLDRIPDPEVRRCCLRMASDKTTEAYQHNTVFQDTLLWIARSYAQQGIEYVEISDTALVRESQAAHRLQEIHEILPKAYEETGVTIRFLAAIRRIPLSIIRNKTPQNNYLAENLRVLRAVASDPYIAGCDIVGEEINDIREMKPVIAQLVRIAAADPSFVIRIHAGENDSLRDNVANSIKCVKESLSPGQPMPVMRIGHGLYTSNLKSAKGKELLKDLRENHVTLEFQITSNVRLNNLSSLRHHPLKQYLHAGVGCVQGTDGAALYGTDNIDEQLTLEKLLDLSYEDMLSIRRTEDEIAARSLTAFEQKKRAFNALLMGDSPEHLLSQQIAAQKLVPDMVFPEEENKLEAQTQLSSQIMELPKDRFPVILAGGSFNNDQHKTVMTEEGRAQVRQMLTSLDPEKVFFVIGYRMKGYEKYLTEQNHGRFLIYAIVPTLLTAYECQMLRKANVRVRLSIEAAGMGVYKSFTYEILKRRPSVLVIFDGNSAGANLIQEAKNGAGGCWILVNRSSRMIRQKAQQLNGYVTFFDKNTRMDEVVPEAIENILEQKKKEEKEKG